MAAYILTWNPQRTVFDEYDEFVERTREGEIVPSGWSCGHTKAIEHGDRLFLLRQRTDRGIVGAGYATGEAYSDVHWDESKEGQEANYVDLEYETLLPVSFRLPIEQLQSLDLGVNWRYLIASGTQVPAEFTGQLDAIWADHLARIGWQGCSEYVQPDEVIYAATYVEGATRRVTVNSHERNRDAREECIRFYGPKCLACGFDFGEVYGEIGQGYIHVHHVRDLATIGREYQLDPMKDLRPVCPNCHSILHTRTPAMSIKELCHILRHRHVDYSPS